MDPSNAAKNLPILPSKTKPSTKTNKQNQSKNYKGISIEVIIWIDFGERKNKIRLSQNVEFRKMAPALRNLTLKL